MNVDIYIRKSINAHCICVALWVYNVRFGRLRQEDYCTLDTSLITSKILFQINPPKKTQINPNKQRNMDEFVYIEDNAAVLITIYKMYLFCLCLSVCMYTWAYQCVLYGSVKTSLQKFILTLCFQRIKLRPLSMVIRIFPW